jgi:hypothetical protein
MGFLVMLVGGVTTVLARISKTLDEINTHLKNEAQRRHRREIEAITKHWPPDGGPRFRSTPSPLPTNNPATV